MQRLSLLLFLILFIYTSHAQNRFESVTITSTQLSENVFMLQGSGGNMGLVIGDGETLLIDDQFGPLSEKIADKIASLGGENVTKIVNTHWHGDHTGGNENFGKNGAMIVAHENVRLRMSTEQTRGERVTPPSPDVALPVITFNDEANLHFFDEPVLLVHVHNAHTDGDILVYLPESNVLHMGDCFFHQRFPFIDLDSGGSFEGMINASEAALMLCNDSTQIIPGHGPLAKKSDLVFYNGFLKEIKSRIEEYTSNGRNLESIDPAIIIKGYEEWDGGFINAERLTRIAYSSLTSSGN